MIYVTGIGIVSALGTGAEANLKALYSGTDGIGKVSNFSTSIDVPVGEVRLSNSQLAQLAGIDTDKPTSRTTLLGMVAAQEALADAGIADRSKVAFISSTTVGGMDLTPTFYREFMADPKLGRLRYVTQHDCASSTNAIADHCGIGGFRTAISTACSSAANAIMMGSRLISNGLADTVVVGGTDALCAYTLGGFKSLMILDSQKCRPFDATRAGLNLGEAAAYIVLQRHPQQGKEPYCQVAGYGNANDAYHQTAVSAEGNGPRMAMQAALQKASFAPSDISYINAHGTGTPNNDASESAAIRSIWGDALPHISSTKAFTGHTLAAAGAIEAVFSIMAIREQAVWPNLNYSTPIEATGIVPVGKATKAKVDAVMSNSFGFGGNCSSVIFAKL